MPQYYSGDNIAPFSSGVAMGFELFDRARYRRIEAEDRKRQIAMGEERMQMAREDQAMQRENFELAKEDRDIRLEDDRIAKLDKRRLDAGARLGELAAVHGGLDKAPRSDVIKLTREGDPTRYASANDDDVYAGATALAMEGSDYIENEALRQRGITEKSDQAEGLLSLQGIAGSAAPATAPRTSQQGRNPPRGLRNNNPGNLRASDTPWRGKVGNDGEFEQFETPEAGLRAASRNLVTGAQRDGANTLRTAISRWAPANENDTAAYIQTLATQLGVDPDAPLDFSNPAVNAAVLGGIVGVENGAQPFSQDQLLAAANAALGVGDVPNAGEGGGSGVIKPPPATLATEQRAKDQAPAPLVAAGRAVVGAATARAPREPGYWRTVADVNAPGGDAARRDPGAIAGRWTEERDMESDPLVRAKIDGLAFTGFEANMIKAKQDAEVASEQLRRAATPAEQAKARASLTAVQDRIAAERKQLDALTAASAKDRIATAMPRPAPAGDRPAQALEGAVAAEKASPQTSTTAAEQRGLTTQMGRMAENPPARFTQEQIKRISRAVATGVITMDQANNLVRYGQMEAPAGMKVTSLGNGVAIMSDGTSYRVLDYSDQVAAAKAKAAGVGKGGLTFTEERARHAAGAKYLTDRLVSMRENSEFDKFGSDAPVHTIVGDFYDAVNSSRSDLESRFGFRLTGEDGNTSLAHLSEGDITRLTGWYARYRAEELDAFFPDGKSLGDYADIAPTGAPAAQSAQGDDGWKVVAR